MGYNICTLTKQILVNVSSIVMKPQRYSIKINYAKNLPTFVGNKLISLATVRLNKTVLHPDYTRRIAFLGDPHSGGGEIINTKHLLPGLS